MGITYAAGIHSSLLLYLIRVRPFGGAGSVLKQFSLGLPVFHFLVQSSLLFLQAKEKSLFGDGGVGVCGYIEMFPKPIRKWIYLNQLKSATRRACIFNAKVGCQCSIILTN